MIVINDGSTDSTPEVAKKFKTRLLRLKFNQGPAHARNLGAKLASGEILIFFDADVIPLENSLREIINFFQKNPQVSAISGFWSKTQEKKSFFAEYKALRDWSYFLMKLKTRGSIILLPG